MQCTEALLQCHLQSNAAVLHLQRLLVTGGGLMGISLNDCFFIDTSTFIVSPAPSLNVGRLQHGLVLLANGRVLALGGATYNWLALDSVEMLDTFAGSWTSVASLGSTRIGLCAFLLPGVNQAGAELASN